MIDTHCHLEMPHFDEDRESVILRAVNSGVRRMLTVGTDLDLSKKALQIADANSSVYCSIGIHPHDSSIATDESLEEIRHLASHPKVLAIGEIGLDFFKNYSPHEAQKKAFKEQLSLALQLDLPIIIHDREAHSEIFELLEDFNGAPYNGVFHCFSGDVQFARRVLDLGFHLSFTGTITFMKEKKSHEVLKFAPQDRIMIETDCPFLTPVPYRGKKRNEPAFVALVAEKLAEIWKMNVQTVERVTTDNAYRLFGFETAGATLKIAYRYRDSLYLNITNRCSNACSFCAKWQDYTLGPNFLRLESEPDLEEILKSAQDVTKYPEVVFCGYGEPTERLEVMLKTARALRERGAKKLRLNTNGQGDLINKRAIAPLLEKVFDAVSVSLNAQDAAAYQDICESRYGYDSYESIKRFIVEVKKFVPEVTATVVNVPGVDVDACRRIAKEELDVEFKVRG